MKLPFVKREINVGWKVSDFKGNYSLVESCTWCCGVDRKSSLSLSTTPGGNTSCFSLFLLDSSLLDPLKWRPKPVSWHWGVSTLVGDFSLVQQSQRRCPHFQPKAGRCQAFRNNTLQSCDRKAIELQNTGNCAQSHHISSIHDTLCIDGDINQWINRLSFQC